MLQMHSLHSSTAIASAEAHADDFGDKLTQAVKAKMALRAPRQHQNTAAAANDDENFADKLCAAVQTRLAARRHAQPKRQAKP
jgi:hypothetical protein